MSRQFSSLNHIICHIHAIKKGNYKKNFKILFYFQSSPNEFTTEGIKLCRLNINVIIDYVH